MSWTRIQGEALQRLQERLQMPPQSTIHEASTLRTPFYDHGELLRMNDGRETVFMVAAGSGEVFQRDYYMLNGESADIHTANKAAGLVLTQGNAIDYLRFFTTFLRNDDGEPFAIIESLNGYSLVNEDRPGQRKPDDMRLVCEGADAEGHAFAFRGYMVCHGQLFAVSMRVHKNGHVEMLDDEPIGVIVRLQ